MIAPHRPPPIPALTSVRGLAALLVVLYHFGNDLCTLFPSLRILEPLWRHGHFAVPFFFMLSGYVLYRNYAPGFATLRRREYARFLVARLARIYPVHLATLLVVLGMVLLSLSRGWSLTAGGYTARDFVLNLFLMQAWPPDWVLN
ncbi:MAG: acyltransferase family protein, partial [Gemmataceae bacterium]